ncbi:acyloxyacyl hydrolase [Algoriphagus algorifonticola]|uniref:acyloxyacyl hydrolase n=1 Tax=Algoriphagus algorifonticola TaxID=2593007 RepID=UPI0016426F34|nr:acyloxyacyl hydrolase [Algoriphagus algorifonticola]
MNTIISLRLFLVLGIMIFSLPSLGQQKYQKILELSYENGPMISNGKEWADEIRDLVSYRGADIRLGWRKTSNNFYNKLYRYPTFGIGFSTALPYYPEIGRPQGFYGFGEFPFSSKNLDKRLYLAYFAQLGLGFNLNPYDSLDNPLNQYIGSELNAYIHFGFKANYRLNQDFELFSTIGLKHYSNGATKRPNAGINLAPIALGVRYNIDKISPESLRSIDYPELEKRGYWNFALYLGSKNYEVGDPSYFRGGFGVNYLWDASYKYRIGLGLDYFIAPGFESRYPGRIGTFSNQSSLAIVGSWEWKLNDRLYMPIGLGAYLHYNSENQESWFYERIGVRYKMNEHLFGGLQIKAHKAKADFFEFTIGYTIPGKIQKVVGN